MFLPSSPVAILSSLLVAAFHVQGEKFWPRAKSLVIFAPLDNDSGMFNLKDESEFPKGSTTPVIQTDIAGPFGNFRTSHTVESPSFILQSTFNGPLQQDITVSLHFYLKSQNTQRGFFEQRETTTCRICMMTNSNGTFAEVWSDNTKLAILTEPLKIEAWNFVTLIYRNFDSLLTIFHNGKVQSITTKLPIIASSTTYYFGHANSAGLQPYWNPGDGMACAMVWHEALTKFEIEKLPEICQQKASTYVTYGTPRPHALDGFWPLDNASSKSQPFKAIMDVGFNRPATDIHQTIVPITFYGPWANVEAAGTIGESFFSQRVFIRSSFTISMYVKFNTSSTSPRTLMAIDFQSGSQLSLNCDFSSTTPDCQLNNGATPVKTFKLNNEAYVFLALTFDSSKSNAVTLLHYDKIVLNATSANPALSQVLTNAEATFWPFRKAEIGDRLSSVFLFNEALTLFEIQQLRNASRHQASISVLEQMPRPDKLVLFAPLNNDNNLKDLAFANTPNDVSGNPVKSAQLGPFGVAGTSFEPSINNGSIVTFTELPLTSAESFTLTLATKIPQSLNGILFEISNQIASIIRVEFKSYATDIGLVLYANGILFAEIQKIILPVEWTFLTFAYDGDLERLEIYSTVSQNAMLLRVIPGVKKLFTLSPTGQIIIGRSPLTTNFACFSLFAVNLNFAEIGDLPRFCQQISNGVSALPSDSWRVRPRQWPRPSNVIGFWPFYTGNPNDIAFGISNELVNSSQTSSMLGPFGFPKSAIHRNGNAAFAVYNQITIPPVFTLLFYYRLTNPSTDRTILALSSGLSIVYKGNSGLFILQKVGDNWLEMPKFELPPSDTWNWFVIGYDKTVRTLYYGSSTGTNVNITGVDIPSFPQNSLRLGWGCDANGNCGSQVQPLDAYGCTMFWSTLLTAAEVLAMPHTCRTEGLATLSNVVPEQEPMTFSEIMPLPNVQQSSSIFTYKAGSFTTNVLTTQRANSENGMLTNPQRNNHFGALKSVDRISKPDWRLEIEFGSNNWGSTDWSRLAVVIGDVSEMDTHLAKLSSNQASNFSPEFFFEQGSNPAVVFTQNVTSTTSSRRQLLSVGGGGATSNHKGEDENAPLHCLISQSDLISGLQLVLQSVNKRLSVSVYSRLHQLPATCFDYIDVSTLSDFITANPAKIGIAVVGSNLHDDPQPKRADHQLRVKEIRLFEFEGVVESAAARFDLNSEISHHLLPLPDRSKKFANLQCPFSFSDLNSLNKSFQASSALPDADVWDLEKVLFDSSRKVEFNIVSKAAIYHAALNLRAEIKFSASIDPQLAELFWFGVTLFDSSSAGFRGVSIAQMLTGSRKIASRFSPWPNQDFNTTISDSRCDLSVTDLAGPIHLTIQLLFDQITVTLLRPGQNHPTYCAPNVDVTGMARMIAGGNAKLAISVPAINTPGQMIKIDEFKIYSLSDVKVATVDTSCLQRLATTTTTTSTTTSTTTTTKPSTTSASSSTESAIIGTPFTTAEVPNSETAAVPVLVKKAESIVETLIPEVELETTNPLAVSRILVDCDDFAAYRAVPPNNGSATSIRFAFQISKLVAIDNVNEALTVDGIILQAWNVTTCSRNETTVKNLGKQKLYVTSPDESWIPKLRFSSSATSNYYMAGDGLFGDDLTVILSENENFWLLDFYWIREGSFTSSCELDLSKFPYDRQTCSLNFEYVRPISTLQIENPPIFQWSEKLETNEWRFISQKTALTERKFIGSKVQGIEFTVVLGRIPDYYLINLALPSALLGCLNMVSFMLPPEMTDRPALTVTSLLALIVAQSDVRNELPKRADRTLLGDYISAVTLFSAIVTIYHIFIVLFSTLRKGKNKIGGCFRERVNLARVIDIAAFLAASGLFIGTHFYMYGQSKY